MFDFCKDCTQSFDTSIPIIKNNHIMCTECPIKSNIHRCCADCRILCVDRGKPFENISGEFIKKLSRQIMLYKLDNHDI